MSALPSTPSRKTSSTVLRPRLSRQGSSTAASTTGSSTAAPQDRSRPGRLTRRRGGADARAARGWVTM